MCRDRSFAAAAAANLTPKTTAHDVLENLLMEDIWEIHRSHSQASVRVRYVRAQIVANAHAVHTQRNIDPMR